MKPLVLCLSAGLLLAGCKKTVESPSPTAPGSGNTQSAVTAAVSGAPDFAASGLSDIDGLYYTSVDPATAPARLVLRSRSAGREITFSLVKFTGPGTYTLLADPNATLNTGIGSYSENNSALSYYTQYQTPAGAVQGQVVVTLYDKVAKHMQGTFSFSAVGTTGSIKGQAKQVSTGKFNVYDIYIN